MMIKRVFRTAIALCILLAMTGCSLAKDNTVSLRTGFSEACQEPAVEETQDETVDIVPTSVEDDDDEATLVLMSDEVEETVSSEADRVRLGIEKYLASLGTSLDQAKLQAEAVRKEEDELLASIIEEEKTWDELAPTTHMTFAELVGDNGVYEYPEGFLKPDTYKIIVDLHYQVVMVYKKDAKGEYTVPVRYMLCSSGANKSQSPIGTFEMKNYRVRFSRFNNTEDYGQYWSLINGRIYFHSILYSGKDDDLYRESTWNNLGTNVSHGCIRLSVPDARFIYYNAAPGTVVEIRAGSSKDKDTKAIREKLLEGKPSVPKERIKITPDTLPNTDNWKVDDIEHEVTFVQGHQ